MNPLVSQYFSVIVTGPEENINLAEAALYIALNEYPDLDTASYLLQLDDMAAELQIELAGCTSASALVAGINDYLFAELGFRGNWRNFNDPRNSFLNDVLDRRLGIPISLSLVYIETGRRLGLSMHGVSFPGHFLVKFIHEQAEYIIDPFAEGIILKRPELLERLQHYSANIQSTWRLDDLLRTAGNREFLGRLLRNLKHIYLDVDDFHHALPVTSLHLMLDPDSAEALRDRARIFDQLDCYRAACEDYKRYLTLNPLASDHELVQLRVSELMHSISLLH